MTDQPQYRVGDVVNGHVWTGSDWQPAPAPPAPSQAHVIATAATKRNGLIQTTDPNVQIGSGKFAGFYYVKGKWNRWDEDTKAFIPAKVTWWSKRHPLDKALIIGCFVGVGLFAFGVFEIFRISFGDGSKALKDERLENSTEFVGWMISATLVVLAVLGVIRVVLLIVEDVKRSREVKRQRATDGPLASQESSGP